MQRRGGLVVNRGECRQVAEQPRDLLVGVLLISIEVFRLYIGRIELRLPGEPHGTMRQAGEVGAELLDEVDGLSGSHVLAGPAPGIERGLGAALAGPPAGTQADQRWQNDS